MPGASHTASSPGDQLMESRADTREALAALRSVSKRYPGVVALDDVTVELRRREVHALVGENGAGKSTLVKLLAGAILPSTGTIEVDGRDVVLRSPHAARKHGITYVPQDVQAVPQLSVGRNIMLGMETGLAPKSWLTRREGAAVAAALTRAGASFDPATPASRLSVPELRLAQLARALIRPGDVVILDEPTAVLAAADAEHLLQRLLAFREAGKAILYISHRISEVLQIADRITVLRDGRNVGTFDRAAVTREQIIRLMAKAEQGEQSRPSLRASRRAVDAAAVVLTAEDLSVGLRLSRVSLTVRAGEIIGVAGLQGSGHGSLLHAVAGIEKYESGSITVAGRRLVPGDVRDSYDAGAILLPADRRGSAIVPTQNVRENVVLPTGTRTRAFGFRRLREERRTARRYVERLGIRPPALGALALNLSGGNQQKLALARALEASPKLLLLEEPLQGIDINAKEEIRAVIRSLASEGLAVLIASSDFEDVLGLADTIHVMCLGHLVAALDGATATYEQILHHAVP